MGYIHVYVVIIFFILATSGDVQISFMKGAPRFNNAMYYDYFFACHTEGEILQWKVNNTNISDYFGQSGIGQVFTRSISNCDYTTTLLSFKLLAMGQSIFDSVLIVSCQNSANLNFDVLCTNGSLSKMTSNSVKETDAEAETIASSVLLEHVLTENVVIADSSNCINIFVCGVDNNFLTIGVNNNNFVFATFNDIGRQDEILRDTTTLESQAILIGRTPYRLIVVMLVIDGAGTNVTCGYDDDNTARMAIMQCPANLETTKTGMSTANGQPLRENNDKSIKSPKKSDKNYEKFYKQVEYIILTSNDNEFNAATTYIVGPDKDDEIVRIDDENICIGKLGKHKVGLILIKDFNQCVNILETSIDKYFSKAKYIVGVGGIRATKPFPKLGDVLISKSIVHTAGTKENLSVSQFDIAYNIMAIFGDDPEKEDGLEVSKEGRKAKHFTVQIASGQDLWEDKDLRKATEIYSRTYGCERGGGELIKLQNKKTDRPSIQIIVISGVTGYFDEEKEESYENWQFMAYQSACHYVKAKMDRQPVRFLESDELQCHEENDQPLKENNDKSIKTPKKYDKDYDDFYKLVEYIILTSNDNEFNAATTYIVGPDEGDIVRINENTCIGKLGNIPVGLIQIKDLNECIKKLETSLNEYFSKAKYIVGIGGIHATTGFKTKLGDVLISEAILHTTGTPDKLSVLQFNVSPDILAIFGEKPEKVDGLPVSKMGRRAKHYKVSIASGIDLWDSLLLQKLAKTYSNTRGCEKAGGELMKLQQKKMDDRKIQIISISGVTGYIDGRSYENWQFMAYQAAFHYVKEKMKPHASTKEDKEIKEVKSSKTPATPKLKLHNPEKEHDHHSEITSKGSQRKTTMEIIQMEGNEESDPEFSA